MLETPGPVLCEVVTIPDEPRDPRVAAVQRADGSMVSKPLEDMWPLLGSRGVPGQYDYARLCEE